MSGLVAKSMDCSRCCQSKQNKLGSRGSRGWAGQKVWSKSSSDQVSCIHNRVPFSCRCPPMPRCAARHVKLVAEAEQLVLPFLAPRVFQPWPRSLPQSSTPSHSQNKSFSTTACEYARHSRPTRNSRHTRPKYESRSTQPKHENARRLLVQQWYESALAPLEEAVSYTHLTLPTNSRV